MIDIFASCVGVNTGEDVVTVTIQFTGILAAIAGVFFTGRQLGKRKQRKQFFINRPGDKVMLKNEDGKIVPIPEDRNYSNDR